MTRFKQKINSDIMVKDKGNSLIYDLKEKFKIWFKYIDYGYVFSLWLYSKMWYNDMD
jgi:hypothetical protein